MMRWCAQNRCDAWEVPIEGFQVPIEGFQVPIEGFEVPIDHARPMLVTAISHPGCLLYHRMHHMHLSQHAYTYHSSTCTYHSMQHMISTFVAGGDISSNNKALQGYGQQGGAE